MTNPNGQVYRVVFLNQGKVYEVFARSVSQGGLFGFVEVEGLLFGERSQLVVDPTEDRLRAEFEGVQRFHVPLHAVLRIDEVEKQGAGRITPAEGGGKVAQFPMPTYVPNKEPST